jgi:hypothetical protein
MKILASIAVLSILAASPLHSQSGSSLDLEDVVTLLPAPPAVRANIIHSRCVSFPLDATATSRLRSAGADEVTLEVIRNACFTGAELVVDSNLPGAEVLVNNQRVGTVPQNLRYATGGNMQVSARSAGRTLNASPTLQPGRRTRVHFGFLSDTSALPRIRTVGDVSRELNLERQWTPAVPAPPVPGPVKSFGDNIFTHTVHLAGAAGGVWFCMQEHACGLPDPQSGEYSSLSLAAGALGGLAVGAVVNYVIALPINSARRSAHQRAVQRRADWERSDANARASWIQSHPQLQAAIAEDRRRYQEVLQRNAEIRATNAGLQPARVTTEPLPGPPSR